MPNFPIITATESDIPSIHQLFIQCTDAMLAAGIGQWHYDYPDEKAIRADVAAQQAFIVKEKGKCLATITLNDVQDEQYQAVEWLYNSGKALVIHRLGVRPDAQGLGLGKHLCLFAETYARDHQYSCIRLDAYAGNPVSNRLYEKLAYHKADGLCYFHGNELPFYCYEKRIG